MFSLPVRLVIGKLNATQCTYSILFGLGYFSATLSFAASTTRAATTAAGRTRGITTTGSTAAAGRTATAA